MKASIRQIAREAGVGVATVMRALHHEPGIASATRERIWAIAERLQYRLPVSPSPTAPDKSTRTIGCIFHALSTIPENAILAALAEHMPPKGFALFIKETAGMSIRTRDALSFFLKQDVGGVVIRSGHDTPIPAELLRQFALRSVPVVTYNYTPTELPCDWVGFDEPFIAEMALRYLTGLGHRRIVSLGSYAHGFVPGRPLSMYQAFHRHQLSTAYFVDIGDSNYGQIVGEMLHSTPRPTCIIVDGIEWVPPIMKIIQALGLQIPAHVSLLSIGHQWHAHTFLPHLSHVALPEHELAERVIQLLQQRITRDPSLGEAPVRIAIQPALVKRSTCAVPVHSDTLRQFNHDQ
jgi:LacI family transcriptional regulator